MIGRVLRLRRRPRCCATALSLAAAALVAAAPVFARGDPPKLFTEQQAKQGEHIYMADCASCHGQQLQGSSAPANAGSAFLHKAHKLGWTVGDLRSLVVTSMPLNNPASLPPKQYADVLAFLLAKDCYPAGNTPFPTKNTAKLKHTQLERPPSAQPANPTLGTCDLK